MYDDFIHQFYDLRTALLHANDSSILNFIPQKLNINSYAGLTIENDFWARNDKPEEVVYRPANRRLFYTKNMIQDLRQTWIEVAREAFR